MKKFYTVSITFADFTKSVDQYEANSPEEAVDLCFQQAECFADYNRDMLVKVMQQRLDDKKALIHVADGLKGVWLVVVGTEFQDFEGELEAIYGGIVVQTDPNGPRRA
ncbi:MAG: hypothetical protein COU22_01425 [Candidatus Komeilibacteria bacterium CG10_big_fil_rev_8_21_14_0_10_41_13]|uniref:Uncharacterized protein n=1 Tax=Candidatus Komeilibacteria bacterium CG10_big_fil_rev_8_21_14_0_10_41_13 TaxID=1974476 RepID=A0A2M6WCR4_9BACT|nr:MAG: hypothetical protein COU22_01425 [Candidatus Komeilibacteria bacterium CG10_big_fil_rev_8_21_14_0_10_41_13]